MLSKVVAGQTHGRASKTHQPGIAEEFDCLLTALRTDLWRSHYETGDYHLPWKRTRGTALVVSPEAFDKLVACGQRSLVIREVVHGDSV